MAKNKYDEGFVSFDPEELKNAAEQAHPNAEAYDLLWEATYTSAHVSVKDKTKGEVDLDDVYPITAEETAEMERLLDEAGKAVKDPSDHQFKANSDELREIIAWSKRRHWKFNWRVIAGVIVSVFLLQMCSDGKKQDVADDQKLVDRVAAWEKPATPFKKYTLEELGEATNIYNYDITIANAENWHRYRCIQLAQRHFGANKEIETNHQRLDTAQVKSNIERYKKNIAEATEQRAEYAKAFEQMRDASFEDIQEDALNEMKEKLSKSQSSAGWVKFWNIFFLLLIPVYIFAARPYGYTISRHRKEAAYLGKIEKIGLWLSGGLLAASAGIGFVDIVTKWSDGSTTREDDGTGILRLAIKLGLLAAAVLVFCFVSCFMMLYATITGLIRNYNWSNVKRQVATAGSAAATAVNNAREKRSKK